MDKVEYYPFGAYRNSTDRGYTGQLQAMIIESILVRKWFVSLASLLFWACLLLISCQSSNFVDATDQNFIQLSNASAAELRSVAWLDEDHIAFVSRYRRGDFRIALYTLSTEESQDIVLMRTLEECNPAASHISELSRLPNQHLGYAFLCQNSGPSGLLYMWDREEAISKKLHEFTSPFITAQYTFAPDMSELIQENAVGPGLNNELYRVDQNGHMEQLLPHFQRARAPSWSPDGKTIAFAGTEKYLDGNSNALTNRRDIEDLLLYPWDLYLMDANGRNVRTVLPEAGGPYQLKWSPIARNLLAFSGDFHGIPGIWLLNTDSLELTRMWAQNTFYDWSPDGEKMVIIAEGEADDTYPIIINVPGESR